MTPKLEGEILHYLSKQTIYYHKFSQELLDYLNLIYPLYTLKAQWYMLKNNITTIPRCGYKDCENPVKWNERNISFDIGCSTNHIKKITSLKNFGTEHPNQNKKQLDKVKKSVYDKYGVSSIAHLDSTQIKRRKTNFEKYGVEEAGASDVVRNKIKQTTLERYGVEEIFSSKEIREKAKQTMLIRYGAENSLSSPEIRNKMNITNISKYGTIFPMKDSELQKKRMNTVLEKYDAYGANAHPEVSAKFKKTVWTKYYNEKLLNNIFVTPLFTIDDYEGVGNYKKYRWLCKTCNSEFNDHLSNGHLPACSICFPRTFFVSGAETDLFNMIDIENKTQTNRELIGCEIDIYLPDYKIGIEYNGMYWHSEQKGKGKYYHLDKTIMAENAGIFLIHIFEYEWITKKIQVLSHIERQIDKFDEIIDINLTIIKTINHNVFNKFLLENSLELSESNLRQKKGIFYNNELVAVLSLMEFDDKVEITRCVEKMGIGFTEHISKKIIDVFETSKPWYYYPNRRYHKFNDEYLLKLGFTLEGATEPILAFSKNQDQYIPQIRINKLNIHKYVTIYDKNLPIYDNMICNNYSTIWDCGKLVFKLISKK